MPSNSFLYCRGECVGLNILHRYQEYIERFKCIYAVYNVCRCQKQAKRFIALKIYLDIKSYWFFNPG